MSFLDVLYKMFCFVNKKMPFANKHSCKECLFCLFKAELASFSNLNRILFIKLKVYTNINAFITTYNEYAE